MSDNRATSLTFQVFGEDKSATKVLKEVAGDADHAGDKLDNMGAKASSSGGHLSKLGGLGKVAGGALVAGLAGAAAAAGAVAVALVDAAKGAMEDQAGAARLAQQLAKTTGATKDQVSAVEDWISKQGESKGFADDQLRPAFQRLAASTKDVGEAQKLTTLAMDISAGTGKDAATVASALAKAHDGNVNALKRLGITLGEQALNFGEYGKQQTAVAKAQDAWSIAVRDFGSHSEQAQAALDKLNAAQAGLAATQRSGIDVMGELGKQFGGAAATQAETLSGRIGRLKIMFDETKETIGYKVIPVVETLVGWFQDKALPVIKHFGETLLPKLQEAFRSVSDTVKENRPGLEKLAAGFGMVAAVLVEKVIPFLFKLWSEELKAVITVLGKLGDALPPLAADFLRFSADAVHAFGDVLRTALAVFDGILGAAEKGMGWIPGIGDKIRSAKASFTEFNAHTVAKIEQVEAGLKAAAGKIDEWDAKARRAEAARVRADISDLESQVETAKKKLADPKLTDPEKAKVKADITDLEEKVKAAQAQLVEVKDRTVTVKVDLQANQVKYRSQDPDEPHGGGGSPAPSTGGAGTGVTRWTHGVGHPGAGWYQAGNWTWAGGHHNGVDVGGVGTGTRVFSTRAGLITHSGLGGPEGGWAGRNVIQDIGGGVELVFAHLSQAIAREGSRVSGGDLMGRTGYSGRVSPKGPGGAHLHVTARRGGTYVNPTAYLARGGVVQATPGGTVVVAGEAGRDEAVVPLPAGWRGGDALGSTTHITVNVSGGLGDRQAVARDVRNALLELRRANGGLALGLS